MESRTRHTVTDDDTAIALGSGDVPVLATPRLLAWMEAATVAAAADRLSELQTTVGIRIEMQHLRASAVGSGVEVAAAHVEAELDGVLRFEVIATDRDGRVLATGTVERAVVDRARFLAR